MSSQMTLTQTDVLIDMDVLEQVCPVIRHCAHPLRLRILDYLQQEGEERTVSDITRAAEAGQAVVSQQLRILKDTGVLASRRSGTNILYSIANPSVLLLLECIRSHCRLGDALAREFSQQALTASDLRE